MIPSNDVAQRTAEIRELIGNNEVSHALRRLMDFARDFSNDVGHLNEVTVLSANYRSFETAERRERFSFAEAKKERTALLFQALDLLAAIIEQLEPQKAA